MAIRGIFKTYFPSGWLYGEYEDLKNQNKTLYRMLRSLYARDIPTQQESFEDAIARLGITEEDLTNNIKKYRLYSVGFVIFGTLLFMYGFFLLFAYGTISGWLLGMAATGFALSQAFRYDFWVYQMKERKLGATLDEWLQRLLGNKGPNA